MRRLGVCLDEEVQTTRVLCEYGVFGVVSRAKTDECRLGWVNAIEAHQK
jgi:hypothetical protein